MWVEKGVGGMKEVLRCWVSRPSLGRWSRLCGEKMNSVVAILDSEGWGTVAQNRNMDTHTWIPGRDREVRETESGVLGMRLPGSNPASGNLQATGRSGVPVRSR